jgi:hypothetical protein
VSTDNLTASGESRREQILASVLAAQRARVRRRRAVRAGAAAAMVLAVSVGVAYVGIVRGTGGKGQRIAEETVAPAPVAHAYTVETDPSILERVSVLSRPAAGVIDDDELRRLLQEAGRREGIVRVGGRAMLESEVAGTGEEGA